MVSGGEGNSRTFRKGRQVNFVDCAIEAEDGLEVGLDDIARQVLDDDDLRVGDVEQSRLSLPGGVTATWEFQFVLTDCVIGKSNKCMQACQ